MAGRVPRGGGPRAETSPGLASEHGGSTETLGSRNFLRYELVASGDTGSSEWNG